jgi:Flp pilus assembly secretin CpaC
MIKTRNALIAAVFFACLLIASVAQTPSRPSTAATPTTGADPKDLGTANAGVSDKSVELAEASPDLDLQAEVQEALGKVPELGNDSLRVAALPDGLELTGSVVNGRERQAAVRIAQSYARGRKVIDHIMVNGRATAPAEALRTTHQANAQP